MRYILFFILIMSINLNAQNLAQILEALKVSNKAKAILEKTKSKITQNELYATNEAPTLGATLSHAKESVEKGSEYSLGFSQKLSHPFAASQKERGVAQFSKAIEQETKHELHLLTLDVASKYHNSCVSKEIRDKAILLFGEQSKRVAQIQKAYELGEISKKDLLFNKLDLAKLHQNVNNYKRTYLSALAGLQERVDTLVINDIECSDLFTPIRHVELKPLSQHDELKSIEYKMHASKAFYEVQDSSFSSLGYEFLYEKELNTQRYTAGLSIPLDTLSSQKEKLRAQQLFMSSSYAFEKASLESEIQNSSNAFVSKLEALYDELILLKDEIVPLNEELANLSKKAFDEGEGNIMEYLDATRSYSLNLLGMLEVKKTYYNELFELYKKADLDFGENNAQ
ncbi:MAG: TolC family protein [Campylobacterales bacterium]|nr:TolC family protein [Campylobacterales bacterium]